MDKWISVGDNHDSLISDDMVDLPDIDGLESLYPGQSDKVKIIEGVICPACAKDNYSLSAFFSLDHAKIH